MIPVIEGPLKAAWRFGKIRPPASGVTFVAKGTFDLRPGGPLEPSKKPMEFCGDEPPPETPTAVSDYSDDFAPFKPNADVLVVGHAYTPEGKPGTTVTVRFQVGGLTKSLVVCGDRTWKRGAAVAEPFTKMELSWKNAFGGPPFKRNPAGKGCADGRLPNVETPGRGVSDPDDRPEPAGFGPISLVWPQRMSKAGTYGKKWLRERWPWPAEDLDWSFFNAAPEDQQVPAYLSGDEEMLFENLHPKLRSIACRLPGLRVRCFHGRPVGSKFALTEVRMRLDTLWAAPDREKLVLVWRGIEDLAFPELPEDEYFLTVAEPMKSSPQPVDHYVALLREKMAGPSPESPPPPRPPTAVAPPAPPPQKAIMAKAAKSGGSKDSDLTGADLAGADLAGKNLAGAVLARADLSNANLAGADLTEAVLSGARLSRADLRKARLIRADLVGAFLEEANLEEAECVEADFSEARMRGAHLKGARAPGAILTRADLTGADLMGANLTGADLSFSRLHRANLNGAILVRASLERVFGSKLTAVKADLTELRATGAALVEAVLREARAGGSIWQRGNLAFADFRAADLSEAEFDQANLTRTKFSQANLRRARLPRTVLRGGELVRANLLYANLWRADLTDADLAEANCFEADFFETVLKGARLDRANLGGTLLRLL